MSGGAGRSSSGPRSRRSATRRGGRACGRRRGPRRSSRAAAGYERGPVAAPAAAPSLLLRGSLTRALRPRIVYPRAPVEDGRAMTGGTERGGAGWPTILVHAADRSKFRGGPLPRLADEPRRLDCARMQTAALVIDRAWVGTQAILGALHPDPRSHVDAAQLAERLRDALAEDEAATSDVVAAAGPSLARCRHGRRRRARAGWVEPIHM